LLFVFFFQSKRSRSTAKHNNWKMILLSVNIRRGDQQFSNWIITSSFRTDNFLTSITNHIVCEKNCNFSPDPLLNCRVLMCNICFTSLVVSTNYYTCRYSAKQYFQFILP
jgi:hypothetical protein